MGWQTTTETGANQMRKIQNLAAHMSYVHDLAALALLGTFGDYWLGSCSHSVSQSARWVVPTVVG